MSTPCNLTPVQSYTPTQSYATYTMNDTPKSLKRTKKTNVFAKPKIEKKSILPDYVHTAVLNEYIDNDCKLDEFDEEIKLSDSTLPNTEIIIKTFNCWNTDAIINRDQIELYLNVIKKSLTGKSATIVILLQGITLKSKTTLEELYPANIKFYEIYGIHEEHKSATHVNYIRDSKDRFCAVLWSHDLCIIPTAMYAIETPSYTTTSNKLGRRTSDWIMFWHIGNKSTGTSPIAICNIWLPPHKRTILKDKPLATIRSVLDDANKLHRAFGYKVIVAGTFNIMPDMIKKIIPHIDFDISHIDTNVSTIQYNSPFMPPKHVDYGLFWGFNSIEEDTISVETSHHAMVQYKVRAD